MDSGDAHSKAHKPLIERRRRERINRSLDELKTLVLHSLNRDERDYSRMEKADILEMAVRFLRGVHQSENIRQTSPKYTAGFNQCAANVMWYVNRSPDIAPDVRLQLLQRLALGLQRVHSNATYQHPPEVPHSQTGTDRFQQPMTSPHSPHMTSMTSRRSGDVTGMVYDVRCHVMKPQEEVCDLSLKRDQIKEEKERGGEQEMPPERRTGREEGTVTLGTGREMCERYRTICEFRDRLGNVPRGGEQLRQDGAEETNSEEAEHRQCFLSDTVWRPF